MVKITCVTGIRGVPFRFSRKWIDSLRNQTVPLDIVVVSYGPRPIHRAWHRRLFSGSGVYLIEVDRDTEIWSEARALNIGIRESNTPYVFTTNADLIYENNFVEAVVRAIESDDNALALSDRIDLDIHGQLSGEAPKCYFGTCIGARRELFDRIRGFDETYQGWGRLDMDFVYSARDMGAKWVYVEGARVFHQYHLHLRHSGAFLSPGEKEKLSSAYLRNEAHFNRPDRGGDRNPDGWGRI